ncbi:MAG: hypothetical protein JNG85_01670 [Spirochaetaceae bacterium]|nr:hypothetical protein [Spirochaetaceae bacterium]
MKTPRPVPAFPAGLRLALYFSLVLALSGAAASAQDAAAPRRPPTLAILDLANAGLDPRADYLAGMIQGLLAFDLGRSGEVALVDRRNLDAVLKEKELAMSAIGADAGAAAEAGRLLGADFLLSGEFIFLGADVLVTLSLTETATARRSVYRDRGGTENLVHRLAEGVFLRLTGKTAAFADPSRERSLVSLRDETPGSIALHSPIIDAEIFVDDGFVGFTTGNERLPFVIENLRPGEHRIRTHLDSSFGVLRLPEVGFGDWDKTVTVEPGKRLVLRDETRHFNDQLYRLIRLHDEERKAPFGDARKLAGAKELSFVDRAGRKVAVRAEVFFGAEGAAGALSLELLLAVQTGDAPPETARLALARAAGDEGDTEAETEAGIVRLGASLSRGYSGWELELDLERTDIRQNMWRE